MRKSKLILGLNASIGIPLEEQISVFQKVGLDGYFINVLYDFEQIKRLANIGQELNFPLYALHAPVVGNTNDGRFTAHDLWFDNDCGKAYFENIKKYIILAKEIGAPILFCHLHTLDDEDIKETSLGLNRLSELYAFSKLNNVKLAFENDSGDRIYQIACEYLNKNTDCEYCWDSGHQNCYAKIDFLNLYKNRICSVHLNDNFGFSNPKIKYNFVDDIHLLPFDGNIDWKKAMLDLKIAGYSGPLVFELKKSARENSPYYDFYSSLTPNQYIDLAVERMKKVRDVFDNINLQ